MAATQTPGRMPRLDGLDHTLSLMADPYRFISGQCQRLNSDVFEARIMLQPTVCMRGAPAAELFYDPARFVRAGAAPEPLRASLFGKQAVQGLDGAAHQVRKALFMQVLAPDRVQALAGHVRGQWQRAAGSWNGEQALPFYGACQQMLARAVCAWAGVPLPPEQAPQRTRELAALFDDAARGLRAHLHARLARQRLERWLAGLIEQVRRDPTQAASDTALHAVAHHRDAQGALLAPRVAATELLNILRPTVAVSVYLTFCALALHRYPAVRETLCEGEAAYRHAFLQEVRRYFPFFPAVAARVRQDFTWQGHAFAAGRRVLLDLYGTNHDARRWPEPDTFDPARFLAREPTPFDLIPQGGGHAERHHRCPGENVAMAVMDVVLDGLLYELDYAVQPPGHMIDMARLPALPRAGLPIAVRRYVPRAASPASRSACTMAS
ncbi:cytochrome P450 [Orrella sp. JC864]|uniref:cytochrome P450 n=1 Tax=Orrella sp. JC864 TaxID=3120298 RepID=UPI00300B92C8